MGEFDEILEKGRSPISNDNERPNKAPPNSSSSSNPASILDLLSDSGALGSFEEKINPEMKSQVLLPLANLLDKYGYSEAITTSDTTNNAINMVVLLNDIIPVLQGLSEYVAGQRNSLDEEDQKFLQEIMDAQESGDFSDLFIDEDNLEEMGEPSVSPNVHPILGEMPDIDLSSGKINWMQVLDPDGSVAEENRKKAMGITNVEDIELLSLGEKRYLDTPNISLSSLEDLAASAGVSLDEVTSADSHVIQKEDIVAPPSPPQLDLINEDLVTNIMDDVIFDTPLEEGVLDVEEEVEIFSDDEMEFVEELDIYRNKTTGEIYEAMDKGEGPLEATNINDEGGDSFEEE